MTIRAGLARRLTIILFAFGAILSAAIGGIGYGTYMDTTFARHRHLSEAVLRMAMKLIDADDMRKCLESGARSETYRKTQVMFNMIKESMGTAYLYVFDLTSGDRVAYYLNALTDEEKKILEARNEIHSLGYEEAYPEDITRQLRAIRDGDAPVAEIVNRTRYGYMLSAYSQVRDSNGEVIGLLGVDIDMNEINGELWSYARRVSGGATAIALFFLTLFILFIRRNVTEPIRMIAEKSSEFANRDYEGVGLVPIKLDIRTKDEIAVLALAFEKMTEDLVRYVSNLTRTTAAKERIESELMVARNIQSGILPSLFPAFPDRDEFDIYAAMTPAREVGGDFYDFFMVDDSHVALVIADVSGKGVPAALMMMVARTLIRNEVLSGGEPSEALERVNARLCEGNTECMFVTAFLGIYHIETGTMKYSNAGHNPPLVIKRDGDSRTLPCEPSLVLAAIEGTRYVSQELALEPGDCVLLYTDGVTEATTQGGELFSDERLRNAAGFPTTGSERSREILERISKELGKFADGAEQSDDITMLALAIRPF
jgi:sigma-B regulation protein RsbU (phosphoserine phosphatase)